VKIVAVPVLVLAAAAAGADDEGPTLGGHPIRIQLPAGGGSQEPGDRWTWHELSVNSSFEFIGSTELSGSVQYAHTFFDQTAVDVQLATVWAWSPFWGGWFSDGMIRPHVGYSYRNFVGHRFTDSAARAVTPGDMEIETVYLGVTLGSGRLPDEHGAGIMGYVTLQAGAAFIERVDVKAPALFAGRQTLIDATTSLYLSAGAGVEVMFDYLSLRLEAGLRSFGVPRDGGSRIDVSGQPIIAGYILVGVTFAF
jgi:hypothetical protein